jgi:putative transposase
MVPTAEQWRWSSAAAHCGSANADSMLEMERWAKRWTVTEWERFLAAGTPDSEAGALRGCTHTGRPLGGAEFVAELERTTLRLLAPQKGGRPRKAAADPRQINVSFVA